MRLQSLHIHEMVSLLSSKSIKSEELVDAFLRRISRIDPEINAYITVAADSALATARRVDEARATGKHVGPLAGVPIAVKDNMNTVGMRTTAGSKMLSNWMPPFNATVVDRLIEAGMIIIGKTNMDEFAMGSSTETSYFGPTKNPWDLSKTPGGTSGGSAAAVAAGEVPAALGSDTGGSIRQPAAFCGVVGMKPTYGRVSRFGLISYASSFDQIGVLSRDIKDCAIMLQVIAGHDPNDATSSTEQVKNYSAVLEQDVRGLKVGIPLEYLGPGVDREIRRAVEQTAVLLGELGVTCTEVSLPNTEFAIPAYYIIATSEASANLARYDGVRFGFSGDRQKGRSGDMIRQVRSQGFGNEVKRRIILGSYALSAGYFDAYYLKAQQVRTIIRRDYNRAFGQVDALLMPVSPVLPFGIGERIDDPLTMYLVDIHTVTANLAGLPGISIPVGLSNSGLPLGIQFQGPHFSEDVLFRLSHAVEQRVRFPHDMLFDRFKIS